MKKSFVITVLIAALLLCSCSLRPVGKDGETTHHSGEITSSADTVQSYENETDAASSDTEPVSADPDDDGVNAKVTFAGCGDNIIYFGTWRDAAAQAFSGGRQYNFKPIYKNVESVISAADIAFINQETCTSQSFDVDSYPTFSSPVDLTYDIAEVGFDVVNLANNHMLDKGAKGLRDSFDNWNARGVTVIGCYEEKADGRYITYVEKNGIKIGFVSYTYGTNLNEDPAKEGLWAPYLKQADIEGDIGEAKKNADFVAVSVHWGQEGAMTPSEEQKAYALRMANAGADVILGHHPHVLQPIEWLETDGGKCLCVYSLGNFVHEQDRDYNVPGGIITFDFIKSNGKTEISSVQFIPTVCHYPQNFYNNTVYFFKDYTQELASAHAVRTYYGNTISLESLESYIRNTIPEQFLPDYMK